MANVTDHLIKLQELTQMNLSILQALNDSLYTKQNHLAVNLGDKVYSIPSFLSLENKINNLQSNFENLVNAPSTGEAYFNFDGNSRSIEVRGYTHTPNSIVLNEISEFGAETNNIFKDFLTPNPFINLSLTSLPNDITTVMVKKIIPIHEDLVGLFESSLVQGQQKISKISSKYLYRDLYKTLSIYEKDVDYIEYDTKMDLPVRESLGNATYIIQQIVSDVIDDNLDEYITIKFRNDVNDSNYENKLSYKIFNETIDRSLKVGDQLITFDDSAKMEITEVRSNSNTVVVKVLKGEYLNLIESTSNEPSKIHNNSKLKFFSSVDFDKDKYIKVSLEEDKYIFVAVAALNNRLNIQSPWGSGLIINAHNLIYDGNNKDLFKTYYDNNVKNVGDVLYEITSMMSNNLTKYGEGDFNAFTSAKPIINQENLLVTQINKHLNDSPTVINIRSLYSQKKNYESKLNEINTQITDINNKLAEISFDDTSNLRAVYTNQLTALAEEQSKLNSSINKTILSISQVANNSEVPIENAKYRIVGFFDCKEFINNLNVKDLDGHVMGIDVQYRYKNSDQAQSNAISINGKFIFSDWINMESTNLRRVPYFEDYYKYKLEDDNSNINEPSFNQIEIPITQGETVDIRIRVVYDLGWPFIYTTSNWSDIVNIKFPDEYLKDVKILDIIEENNNDIETNRFNNILKDSGIYAHINDGLTDQDIKYYHKPEDIASGFYTAERRVIPLKDKLISLDNTITSLYDDVYGSNNENLTVSVLNGDSTSILQPYVVNGIDVSSYDSFGVSNYANNSGLVSTGNYVLDTSNGLISALLQIKLSNNSTHTLKLYSMFPGSRDVEIKDLLRVKSGVYKEDYVATGSVFGIVEKRENNEIIHETIPQFANQYLTFRMRDVNDGRYYYQYNNYDVDGTENPSKPDYISYNLAKKNGLNVDSTCLFMYPSYTNDKFMCLDSDVIGSYKTLAPGESIVIPVVFEYKINMDKDSNKSFSRTMSFDIRTSLYKDPITYTFKVTAKGISSSQDRIISARSIEKLVKYNIT